MDVKQEVRDFLVSRRSRITPERAGLPAWGGNRRVKGLRREEVAARAGISTDYYLRLERGTGKHPSPQVLNALALALALDPKVLLLDEPTAGMGPEERWRMIERVHRLREARRMTLVFIEHDMDILFGLAQRVLVMDQGRLLIDGTPDEVRSDDRVREAYMGTAAGSGHL